MLLVSRAWVEVRRLLRLRGGGRVRRVPGLGDTHWRRRPRRSSHRGVLKVRARGGRIGCRWEVRVVGRRRRPGGDGVIPKMGSKRRTLPRGCRRFQLFCNRGRLLVFRYRRGWLPRLGCRWFWGRLWWWRWWRCRLFRWLRLRLRLRLWLWRLGCGLTSFLWRWACWRRRRSSYLRPCRRVSRRHTDGRAGRNPRLTRRHTVARKAGRSDGLRHANRRVTRVPAGRDWGDVTRHGRSHPIRLRRIAVAGVAILRRLLHAVGIHMRRDGGTDSSRPRGKRRHGTLHRYPVQVCRVRTVRSRLVRRRMTQRSVRFSQTCLAPLQAPRWLSYAPSSRRLGAASL